MTVSLVAHTITGAASGATTSNIDTSGANLIVCSVAYGRSGSGPTSLSDSKSNTWTESTRYPDSTGYTFSFFYCVNPVVGSGHNFTIDTLASNNAIQVSAFSGLSTSSPFDQINGTNVNGFYTDLQPGSITPTQSGDLLITALANDSQARGTTSVDNGFTSIDNIDWVGGTNGGLNVAWLVQGAAAAINPSWTWANTVTVLSSAIISFKTPVATTRRSRLLLGVGI